MRELRRDQRTRRRVRHVELIVMHPHIKIMSARPAAGNRNSAVLLHGHDRLIVAARQARA
ncbi:hypothetical protein GCM10027610_047500 [Dactylosporangium cerinum]